MNIPEMHVFRGVYSQSKRELDKQVVPKNELCCTYTVAADEPKICLKE
jgi:hypothetical protein